VGRAAGAVWVSQPLGRLGLLPPSISIEPEILPKNGLVGTVEGPFGRTKT